MTLHGTRFNGRLSFKKAEEKLEENINIDLNLLFPPKFI
jgi:hypothetical protein